MAYWSIYESEVSTLILNDHVPDKTLEFVKLYKMFMAYCHGHFQCSACVIEQPSSPPCNLLL